MKSAMALSLLLLLTGCAGVMGGGSSYRVEWTNPDGTVVKATADSAEKSQEVQFSLTRDAFGQPVISFGKKSEAGSSNPVIESLATGMQTAIETLAPLAKAAAVP